MAAVDLDQSSRLDITCRRGDTFNMSLTLKDSSGNPLELETGNYQFIMQVRGRKDSSGNRELIIGTSATENLGGTDATGTNDANFTFDSDDQGNVTIKVTANEMRGLKPGSYTYDFQYVGPNTTSTSEGWPSRHCVVRGVCHKRRYSNRILMATDVFINNSNQPAKTIVLSNTANYSVVVQNPSTKATVEIYAKGPKGDRGNANVGGGSLGEVLNVTNPIGEADTNYPVATSLEAILRDMLNSNERPDITPSSASFGYIDNGGSFVEHQGHQNRFEIGDELWLSSITLTSSNLLDIYGNTSIQLAFTDPSADPSLQNAYPLLIKPVLGWDTFPSSTTVSVGTTVGVASPIELDYTSIGKKSIQAQFTWSDNDDADPVSSFNELPFYIGKKIRCFTSHGIDPNATNVINPGNYPLVLNHWDPNNSAFFCARILKRRAFF